MRAVALNYDRHSLEAVEVQEPELRHDTNVVFRVAATGVCGTDRDLAKFRFGHPPEGERHLVLGHEALGQVVSTGARVSTLSSGDWVVPMVRRACSPPCISCLQGRRDLCISGRYTERGIMGAHGYFCELAVDDERDLVRVPAELVDVAVLAEPLSVVEKAVAVAVRLHAGEPRSAAVLGAGTVGLLASLVLRQMGLETFVCSEEPASSDRARLVRDAGFRYTETPDAQADVVIEATGSPDAVHAGIILMAPLGVLIILGAQHSTGELPLRDLILGNRTVAGSVNAGPEDWRRGLDHLARFDGRLIRSMIHREPFDTFRETIMGPPSARPKTVHMIE